jgi:hypothetical protein
MKPHLMLVMLFTNNRIYAPDVNRTGLICPNVAPGLARLPYSGIIAPFRRVDLIALDHFTMCTDLIPGVGNQPSSQLRDNRLNPDVQSHGSIGVGLPDSVFQAAVYGRIGILGCIPFALAVKEGM